MCFTKKIFCFKHTAKKEIVCYKILRKRVSEYNPGEYWAPIRPGYRYTLGETKPVVNLKFWANNFYDKFFTTNYISEGYHSYKSRKIAENESGGYYAVVKCIIPIGSTYYVNNREIVSSSIKPIEELKCVSVKETLV